MHDYSTHHRGTSARPAHKKENTGIVIAIILLFVLTITVFFSKKTFNLNINHTNTSSYIKNEDLSGTPKDLQTGFMKNVDELISTAGGTFSVYIYDIKNNKEYGIHPQTVLTAASLNKIAILAALYHLAGNKEIDLEKIITLQKDDIQDYGTGSMRYDPPGTTYSIKTLARLMMEKSDNTAAYILASQIIGMDKIQEFINTWGLTQTSMVENETSAKDMGILLIKMYKGEITTPPLTAEMLNFMEKTDFDDRLPAGLPSGVKIYHKTGDEIGKIHDVGIINLPKRPYFLGVLSSDMTDENKAKNIISEVSRTVFTEMKK